MHRYKMLKQQNMVIVRLFLQRRAGSVSCVLLSSAIKWIKGSLRKRFYRPHHWQCGPCPQYCLVSLKLCTALTTLQHAKEYFLA